MKDFQQGKGLQQLLDTTELQFLDVTEFEDYADLMRHVAHAKETFMELAPDVRALFDHSVEKWLDSAHDERRAPAARAQTGREGDEPEVVATAVADVEPVAAPQGSTG